ncbi:efflux RND transporter periplasmic adaptor subunit [Acidovorax sp. DW039]|uniref:efflux RND transporter periplasmic adaptor subunit n=1 Tax=Acidovorax sp. DW039 TaxID=3095606 RepID=UPI00308F3FAE|nr:efflux RND transporter periplasmic adaptor subunit [Acidovorax sp. DW039]
MKRKTTKIALAVMTALGIGLTTSLLWGSSPAAAEGTKDSTAKAQAPAPAAAYDRVKYPEGAAQLAMIQSRALPATPVPVTAPLSARVVYDEDVTARIGVGFSGRIVSIKVAPGDSVKAGQVLAEIDSPDFGSANADLSKARADEERKRLVLDRAKELTPGEGIAAKDLELARADYEQARAETARAELRLKNLNPSGMAIRGQRVALVSPMTGVVTERSATPALEVSPGMANPLFVVTDPARLWLMVDLPERLLGQVKLGNKVIVNSDAYPHETFDAKVVQLGQTIDPNTRRASVRARLLNHGGKLLPEMFVRAAVLQDLGNGVQVPNSAIVRRGVYAYVYVETTPGEFVRREVKLLTQGSESSYVGEGLKGGERVVVTGAMLLDAEISARAANKS